MIQNNYFVTLLKFLLYLCPNQSYKHMKILDCTFRDGGYYTHWDFQKEIVDSYIAATNLLPIDYLEIGYRNMPTKEYLGKFGYTPISILEYFKKNFSIDIKVMGDENIPKYQCEIRG